MKLRRVRSNEVPSQLESTSPWSHPSGNPYVATDTTVQSETLWGEVAIEIARRLPPKTGLSWTRSGGNSEQGYCYHYQYFLSLDEQSILQFGIIDNGLVAMGLLHEADRKSHDEQVVTHVKDIFQLLRTSDAQERRALEQLSIDNPGEYQRVIQSREEEEGARVRLQTEIQQREQEQARNERWDQQVQLAWQIVQIERQSEVSHG